MPRGTQDTGLFASPDAYRTLTLYRWPFQNHSARLGSHYAGPTTPTAVAAGLGFSTFARHYSRNCFLSSGYSDVSLPRVPSPCGVTRSSRAGFPHSDIAGSQPAHGSPALFAVYHVLLRPLSPRHPPSAFGYFFSRAENALSLCPLPLGGGSLWSARTSWTTS